MRQIDGIALKIFRSNVLELAAFCDIDLADFTHVDTQGLEVGTAGQIEFLNARFIDIDVSQLLMLTEFDLFYRVPLNIDLL